MLSVLLCGCKLYRSFGKVPSGDARKKIEQLPNYRDGAFQNDEPYTFVIKWKKVMKDRRARPATVKPDRAIPVVRVKADSIRNDLPTAVWYGHSSVLLRTRTANILMDPNFSGYAGPVRGFMKGFKGTEVFTTEDLPQIDILIISHDHFDHLNYETVKKLRKTVKRVIVPMGVGSHFRYWGFSPDIITELNWHEKTVVNDQLEITLCPVRHASGRSTKMKKTLWGSYTINADGYRIYFSGDGGYGKHFADIGEKYGPFDLALMECGQYGRNWYNAHMFPHQTARAVSDIKAKLVIPIHWAKFAEAYHPWNESVTLMLKSADSLQLKVCIPKPGEPYTIGDSLKRDAWWEF